MNLTREQMLAEMGITPIWRPRAAAPAGLTGERVAAASATTAASAARASPAGEAVAVDALSWPDLAAAVANCKACPLGEQRRQAVLGVCLLYTSPSPRD